MKKILYGLLSACFIMLGMLSVCTMTASATTTVIATGDTGGCTYTLTRNEGEDETYTLTISPKEGGDGRMGDCAYDVHAPWYDVGSQITELIIEDQVTYLGFNAFEGCSSLTSVTIPGSVTSIGEYVFYNCSGLMNVTIPGSVTSIGYGAFEGCISLASVTIPEGVTSTGVGAFKGCISLTSVTIPGSVTSIDYGSFWGCISLTSVTIPERVTSIGALAFESCASLTNVTIPEGVTSIGAHAFGGCSSWTNVTIPDSVTSIGENAFWGVSNVVYKGTAEGSPWGARCVNGCKDGDFIYEDSSKEVLCAYIGEDRKVTIPDGVTSIGALAFYNCSGLTSVEIPEGVTSIGYGAFRGCSSLTNVEMPESVTSIGEDAFCYCSSLESVKIPESVTLIGDYAFWSCSSLTSIEIPESVTSMGEYAFGSCSSLTSVTIAEGVTSIGALAFYNCSGLTSVEIPRSVTSIGGAAFDECSSLETVNVSCAWDDTLYEFDEGVIINKVLHDVNTSTGMCNDCEKPVNDWAKLKGHSLTLKDEIGLNFVVALGEAAQNKNTKAVFTIPSGDKGTERMTVEVAWSADKTMVVDDTTCYVFTCPIAAKQMSDVIRMQLVVNGVSELSESYSVRDYAVSVLKEEAKAAAHDVVKAMLNYGAYAQEYFEYHTEDLANVGYEDQDLAIDIKNLQGFTPVVIGSNDTLSYAGSTILLESEIKVRHYFKLSDGMAYSGELKQYVAPDGETVDGTYYYYESEGIKAKELGSNAVYTGVESIRIEYNPLSYVTTVVASTTSDLKADSTLQNLMKALYLYYQKVVAYNGVV